MHNPETMVKINFDPAQRREGMAQRVIQLRLLIPQFEEEKARLEGAISLLDEIIGSTQPTMPEVPDVRAADDEMQ